MIDLKQFKTKKIAWGITGAGHHLLESIETISGLIKNGYHLEIFISKAGEEVTKMFGVLDLLKKLAKLNSENAKLFFASDQGHSFPICGRFSIDHYPILIISPATANTVAKIANKIADTLITNIVSQSLKGTIPVYIVPTDYSIGKCETIAPLLINHGMCSNCPDRGILVGVCPNDALQFDSKHIPAVNLLLCNACQACVQKCPHQAISFGKKITINIHESDIKQTQKLQSIRGMYVLQSLDDFMY